MPSGGCLCGQLKVEYSGEPAMTALCHCGDCRKISGGNYSNNIVVPVDQFKITSGTPKEYTKTADSGKSITSCFCPDCGSTVFRYGDAFGGKDGMRIIKAGTLDDISVINSTVPGAELFAPGRVKWVSGLSDAKQLDVTAFEVKHSTNS